MISNRNLYLITKLKIFNEIKDKYDLKSAFSIDRVLLYNEKNVVYFSDFLQEDRLTIDLLNWDSSKVFVAIWGLYEELCYENGLEKKEVMKAILMQDEHFNKLKLSSDQKKEELSYCLAFLYEKGRNIFSLESNSEFLSHNISIGLKAKLWEIIETSHSCNG